MERSKSVFAGMALIALSMAQAQTDTKLAAGTASFTGAVLDQTGKAIPQASVAVTNEASGALRSTTTHGDGRFAVTGLPAGTYSVRVVSPGFTSGAHTGFTRRSGRSLFLASMHRPPFTLS